MALSEGRWAVAILRNDSKNGKAKFTDVTNEVAPELKNIGLGLRCFIYRF